MPKSKTEERVEKVIGGFHNPNLKVHLRVSAIQRYYSGINYPTLKRGVIYSRDKKNQRLATLIFLIRIRILIVRNIKCSVIKDILLFSYLHPFWKKILEDVKGVPDLDLAAFDHDRTPSRFLIKRFDGSLAKIFIHAFAGCTITRDF